MAGSKNSTLAIDCKHLEKLQKIVLDYNKNHPTTPTNGKNLIALVIDYMSIQGCEYLFEPIFEKPKEVWKDILGYKGQYQVSNFGRVRRVEQVVNHPRWQKKNKRRINELILTSKTNIYGEEYVTLSDGEIFTINALLYNHF